jgi:hypothetical protein
VTAIAEEAVGPALGEGRVGEERGGHRLQRQADAELLHHVGFRGEVQVHLHRAGAQHHVEAEVALLGHVFAHDLVAPLGHPGDVLARPLGVEAQAHGRDVHRPHDLADLVQVGVHLAAGVVDGLQGRARELHLAARLQGHAGAVLGQRDDVVAFLDPCPAEPLQALQQGADAALALVGQRAEIVEGIAELLVLGADAPIVGRLAACLQVGNELCLVGQGFALALRRSGHDLIPLVPECRFDTFRFPSNRPIERLLMD